MKTNLNFAKVAKIFATAFAFISCGKSFDYGSAPRTDIDVNAEAPDWTADIQFLMEVKCMNCHASPRPKLAPTTTPAINFTDLDTFKARKSRITARVFNTPEKPMPELFATQLSDKEKLALQNYIAALPADAPVETTPTTTEPGTTPTVPAALSAAFVSTCAGCHGSNGEGGVGLKLKGTTLTETAWTNTIRSGRGSMPAYPTSGYSATDLSADYLYFKNQAP